MSVHPSFPFHIPGLPFIGFGLLSLFLTIVWIVLGVVIGGIKNKQLFGGILGFLLGPLGVAIIAIVVAVSPGNTGPQCPECKKRLPKGVVGGCPHCGARF